MPEQETQRATRDSVGRSLLTAFLVCFACSAALSVSTALLRPIRLENEAQERSAKVMELLAKQPGMESLVDGLGSARVEQVVVTLGAAERELPKDRDLARIQTLPAEVTLTVVRRDGNLLAIVVPVYGRGYASLIRGSVVLGPDANTIVGLAIHEHGETPGIGTGIERDEWRARWVGKQVRDAQGAIQIRVGRSDVEPGAADATARVDGVTGATFSSTGVGNMVRFWMSDDGVGPFLAKLRAAEAP